jgi:hypothetical protein
VPTAIKHCQKIGGALRRRRLIVIAISFNFALLRFRQAAGFYGPRKLAFAKMGER